MVMAYINILVVGSAARAPFCHIRQGVSKGVQELK